MRQRGLVQHAAGGSLMLDEIAEMPVELQPKLLRVLQERSYRKIGSEKTYAVDFRLISSTIVHQPTPSATVCYATTSSTAFLQLLFTCRPCANEVKIFNS